MKYGYTVKMNGVLYPAGTEVPVGAQVNVELTDNVPDGALDSNPDGSANVYDENENVVGTVSEEEVAKLQELAGAQFEEAENPKRGRKQKSE